MNDELSAAAPGGAPSAASAISKLLAAFWRRRAAICEAVAEEERAGQREAARAASLVRPDVVIPCHYGPVMGQLANIKELKRAVKFLSPNTEVVEMKVGQTLTFTASSHKVK